MSASLRGNVIPWILATVSGIIMYVQYYFNIGPANSLAEAIKTTTIIVSTMAMAIGTINLVGTHTDYLRNPRTAGGQKVMSIYWMFCCFATMIGGLIPPLMTSSIYNFMMEHIRIPANIAAVALFPPWILVAAYRAFKIRNFETLLFTVSAFFVALGNVPIGGVIWSGFPLVGSWLTQKVTAAVFRAITIGIGIGLIAMALRLYLMMNRALYRAVEA
jgi:hypothetical protein